MATLKKGKLDAVTNHILKGGDVDVVTIADLVGTEPEDIETINAYVRRANKDIESARVDEGEEESDAPETPVRYQLKDDNGILRDLDVVKVKEGRMILQFHYVSDTVPILVRGEEVLVDLNELRKLSPDELKNGVKVSALIAAAELARL
jgi:hypothetical protein